MIDKVHTVILIGAGSVGGKVALLLAQLARNIPLRLILCDFDTVEPHNTVNQLYRSWDVGRAEKPVYKVDALRNILNQFCRGEFHALRLEVNEDTPLSGIVISAVDSMEARQKIFKAARFNGAVPLYIDARSGGLLAGVWALNPCDPDDVSAYEKTLYEDKGAAPAPCASPLTIFTLDAIASVVGKYVIMLLDSGFVHFHETLINFDRFPNIQTRTLFGRR